MLSVGLQLPQLVKQWPGIGMAQLCKGFTKGRRTGAHSVQAMV
jgi:hypothetical protein